MQRRYSGRRTGAVNTALVYLVGSLIAIGLLGWFLVILPGLDKNDGPDEIVLYCAAGIKKPVAEAVRQLGVAADRCLAVGDSRYDVEAARTAGCGAVCVLYAGAERYGEIADLAFPDVRALARYLRIVL